MRALLAFLPIAVFAQPTSTLDNCRSLFDRLWKETFSASQPVPIWAAIEKTTASPCGKLRPGNAYYCEKNNTIYYDPKFLSALQEQSGHGAPVTVLAHEYGHAYFAKLQGATANPGISQRFTGYGQEKIADCYAGALFSAAIATDILSAGDIPSAEQALTMLADTRSTSRHSHPNWRTRIDNFRTGLRLGASACSTFAVEKLGVPR